MLDGLFNWKTESCRSVKFDDVKCGKKEVKKVAYVYVNDYYNKCETKTLQEKKTITVKIRRDVCTSSIKPIRVSTTIPVTKQVCDDFPKDEYKDSSSYKKTPDCKIIKSEKIVYTTDHVTKWVCKKAYKEETIQVPVKFYKEVCKEYPKKRKVTVPVWVKEKACYVNMNSKKVCGKTDVDHLYIETGKGYYDDKEEMAYKPMYDKTYDDSSYDDYKAVGYEEKGYKEEYKMPAYKEEYKMPAYKEDYKEEYKTPAYDSYEAPKYEAPKYEAPKYEMPKYEAPKYEKPKYADSGYEQEYMTGNYRFL
jgi:hypothetical protein